MKLNTLLTLNAIAALLFAVIAWLAPAQLLATYGAVTDPTGHLMTRYFGSVLIGIALWSWLGRRISDPALRRSIIIVQIVPWLFILVIDSWSLVAGLTDAREWGNIILALLFLAGYGYCWAKPALQTK
jgi:hypothetical protein